MDYETNRQKARDEFRKYLESQGTINEGYLESARIFVDKLPEQFLEDAEVATGLAICLYETANEVRGLLEVAGHLGGAEPILNKKVLEFERSSVKKASKFLKPLHFSFHPARERRDYEGRLNEILSQWHKINSFQSRK